MTTTCPPMPIDDAAVRPAIAKARRLHGRTLVLRNAATADAPFILGLRTDERLARHLSPVTGALAEQMSWLDRYAADDGQAYFIIETADAAEPVGSVRLYDARGHSFSWGSWIVRPGAGPAAAIESALIVYAYGLDTLGFGAAHFEVRKENTRVWTFHERFGAVRTAETETQYLYAIVADAIRASMRRYRRYLPEPIRVELMP